MNILLLLAAVVFVIKIAKVLQKLQTDEQSQSPSSDGRKPLKPEVVLSEPWNTMVPPQEVLRPETEASGHTERKRESPRPSTPDPEERKPIQATPSVKDTPHHTPAPESSTTGEDFSIQSAEEARRAIIWGEIIQRKYE